MSLETSSTVPVVLFTHQGHYFALEAVYVRTQGNVQALACDSHLLPLAVVLGEEVGEYSRIEHYLEFATPAGSGWLGLAQTAELVELPVSQISALPPLLQGRRNVQALQAFAWYRGVIVSILDARLLPGAAQ